MKISFRNMPDIFNTFPSNFRNEAMCDNVALKIKKVICDSFHYKVHAIENCAR
jgi:hypothetical protein